MNGVAQCSRATPTASWCSAPDSCRGFMSDLGFAFLRLQSAGPLGAVPSSGAPSRHPTKQISGGLYFLQVSANNGIS